LLANNDDKTITFANGRIAKVWWERVENLAQICFSQESFFPLQVQIRGVAIPGCH